MRGYLRKSLVKVALGVIGALVLAGPAVVGLQALIAMGIVK